MSGMRLVVSAIHDIKSNDMLSTNRYRRGRNELYVYLDVEEFVDIKEILDVIVNEDEILDELDKGNIIEYIEQEEYFDNVDDDDLWEEVTKRSINILDRLDLSDEEIINYLSEDKIKSYLRDINIEKLMDK